MWRLLCAIVVLATLAQAQAANDWVADPGWLLLDVTTPSASEGIDLWFNTSGPTFSAAFLYRRDGTFVFGNQVWGSGSEFVVESDHSAGSHRLSGPRLDPADWVTGVGPAAGGEWTVLLLTAGEIESWRWVSRDPTMSVVERASGPTHVMDASDFEGGASLNARALGHRAIAAHERAATLSASGTLFLRAFAGPPLTSLYAGATLRGSTMEEACPCIHRQLGGPGALGPGDYHLSFRGVGASIEDSPLIVWADIPS